MPSPEPVPVQVRSPVRAGQVVDDKYRVDGVLGAGGMGIVVSATHLALDEQVALKFMTLDEGRGDVTSRARFLREAKAARRLTSAHVARVFDVGQLPTGEPYIVMELLKGDDLARHLRTQGRLTAADTVRFMLQVCDAIKEAHALGIVHRDLKPQNLFLAERAGGTRVIKVLDFGIAKSLESTDSDASLTTSQNVVGSPIYMSPEQLRASKHVDKRTDIWSLGVIMFELLSGKVPFVGDSVLELGMRIMTVPAPSLTELRAEVPSGLADIVQRCLEKDPEKRFPDIDALASALRPFIDVSHRSLPFADTATDMEPPSTGSFADQLRTGGEFAGTKGGTTTPTASKATRAWTALGAVVAVGVVVALAMRGNPTGEPTVAKVPVPVAPSSFRIDLRVTPATATVSLDGDHATATPFGRDLPRDGRPHVLAVEAPGFEPMALSFRDVAPPSELTLKPLPAVAPPPAPEPQPVSATTPPTPRKETRPRPAAPPAAATPQVAATPAAVSSPPKTTNESPIVR
jgi:serine/threonine-protein kinase